MVNMNLRSASTFRGKDRSATHRTVVSVLDPMIRTSAVKAPSEDLLGKYSPLNVATAPQQSQGEPGRQVETRRLCPPMQR